MRILILSDADADYNRGMSQNMISSSDLVIVKREKYFDIVKSRYGKQYSRIPNELLSQVIQEPNGNLKCRWEKNNVFDDVFDDFLKNI